jgi:hypothetical protein
MSSAILYLAIIAIWAGILIPRWLHRDTSRITSAREAIAQELATTGDPADDSGTTDVADEAQDDDDARDRDFAPDPASREEARRRVLAARRRLLWMLLGLEVAGAGLAMTGLAAWWVLAPPTVMLAGYLVLLREAAAADSERGRPCRRGRRPASARSPAPGSGGQRGGRPRSPGPRPPTRRPLSRPTTRTWAAPGTSPPASTPRPPMTPPTTTPTTSTRRIACALWATRHS